MSFYSPCPLSCSVCYAADGTLKPGSEAKKIDNFIIQSQQAEKSKSDLFAIDFSQVEEKLITLDTADVVGKANAYKEIYGDALPFKSGLCYTPGCADLFCKGCSSELPPTDELDYEELFNGLPWE
ncbi:hypothetical protein LCGC14_0264570 [marine sediment metagenome]|uniref:Uncharacterized protein n=1 Tax=marine sediment metagenome TaxID=412755 RepID=A0A0F9U0Z6_9ZZZZ